jgi:hypothetical protein
MKIFPARWLETLEVNQPLIVPISYTFTNNRNGIKKTRAVPLVFFRTIMLTTKANSSNQ